MWGCEGGYCTLADCVACNPTCVGGEWTGITESCGYCTYGDGDL
jgi:hypothetical protein